VAAACVALPRPGITQGRLPGFLAVLRLETLSIGASLSGAPKASFTLEITDGSTKVKLATEQMFTVNAEGLGEPCPGITSEPCVGDFAVNGVEDERFGQTYTLSVTEGPAGAIPVFSGDCDRVGRVTLTPHAVLGCRVTFVNVDTGKAGNSAVHVVKQWDTSRAAAALPEGALALFTNGGLAAEIKLSELRNNDEWLAGVSLENGSTPVELLEKIDAPGWIGFVSGQCNSNDASDVLAIGRLLKCVVTNYELEASVPNPTTVLRIETVQIGPALTPQSAEFKVTSRDGAATVSLHSKQMYGPDLLPDGRQSACPGISSTVCSGDVGLSVTPPSNPKGFPEPYDVLVTSVPAGTFPVFSGACGAGGRLEVVQPGTVRTCRITFVNADTATPGANAAVHIVKAWDISRPSGPLPGGTLTLAVPGEGVSETVPLSSLRDNTDWLAGLTMEPQAFRAVTLAEAMNEPGWLTTIRGDCDGTDTQALLAVGVLLNCEVSNVFPEVSITDKTADAALRIETTLLGTSLKTPAAATFRLRSLDGKVDLLLDSGEMYRLNPPSGVPELCPGVSSEVCVGDFGVKGEFLGPHSFGNYSLSVVSRPPGTIAIFSEDCPPTGLLEITPRSFQTCRVAFLQADTGGADADAAVHIIKTWDADRPAGPLPDGVLMLDAEPNGGRTAEMPLSKLRNGTEWVAGVTRGDKVARVTITEKIDVPGWLPLVSGDCNRPKDPSAVLRPGQAFTCTVFNMAVEAYPKPDASISGVAVVEGNAGTKQVVLTVALDYAPLMPVRIAYATANGTAAAPADYLPTAGTLTFTAGQMTATLSVTVNGEILGETNETFRVVLSSAEGANLDVVEATVTIVNDDDTTPPVIAAKSTVIVETRAAPIAVPYTSPTATDLKDGKAIVECTPKSGALLPFGTTGVKCTAQDFNGNVGSSGFSIIVRTPTTTGAVTNPGNGKLLTQAGAGRRVRVSAGGFAPHSRVRLLWIGPAGETTLVDGVLAGADGRIDVFTKVPKTAASGPSQMTAAGTDVAGDEFVRAWKLTVVE
jgi:hypothetical protein